MNALTQFIKLLKDGKKAFKTYPVVIGSGIGFAIITMIRIQLDWEYQAPYNFLFNCLHLALAVGGIFSLALLTAEKIKYNTKKTFLIANLIGVLAISLTFLLLYLWGGVRPEGSTYMRLSNMASARGTVAILVSLLTFTIIASYPKEKSSIPESFFMTEKAIMIALIYGLVIMAGTSGVAGAVQGLLYRDMSEKVYMYLSTLSGFLAFTIFVGYFPDFKKDSDDPHREVAQKQPKFLEILLEYILVPIVLALTVVLILWAGKTVIQGIGNPFMVLSGIAATYTLGGLWLHLMVSDYESEIAKFYRKIYPFSALIILVFEAWALVTRLQESGLKTEEYMFSIIWIVALISAVLLIIKKSKAYKTIIIILSVAAVLVVMPFIGYQDLTINMQLNRLEKILIDQEMLIGGEIVLAEEEVDKEIKIAITDAVTFISYSSERKKLPDWFSRDLAESVEFRQKFGFEKTWQSYEEPSNQYMSRYLTLPTTPVNISDYDWVINYEFLKEEGLILKGENGEYEIFWNQMRDNRIPSLTVILNGETIIEEDMNEYLRKIEDKYPPGEKMELQPTIEDMTYIINTEKAEIMLEFREIEISVDPQEDRINYWLGLDSIYLKEQ